MEIKKIYDSRILKSSLEARMFNGGIAEGNVISRHLLILGSVATRTPNNSVANFVYDHVIEAKRPNKLILFNDQTIKDGYVYFIYNPSLVKIEIVHLLDLVGDCYDRYIFTDDFSVKFAIDCLDNIALLSSETTLSNYILNHFGGSENYFDRLKPDLENAGFSEPIWRAQTSPWFRGKI